jgi:acyl phosphate:glycerol-3-phosphate acyltransferase
MKEALALLLAYLLGSIPTAYLVTRRLTGRDINLRGSGNVGALNTLHEVGLAAGAFVFIFDVLKGALAVALACFLKVSPAFAMLAGLGAVLGHLWMPWLGFRGGKGVSTSLGALTALFLIYGHPVLLLIFLGIVVLPLLPTRNVALAMGIGLFALPLIVWLGTHDAEPTLLAFILFALLGLRYLPTMLRARGRNKTKGWRAMLRGDG